MEPHVTWWPSWDQPVVAKRVTCTVVWFLNRVSAYPTFSSAYTCSDEERTEP